MTIEERSTKIYRTKSMYSEEELWQREHRCVHEEPPYCNAVCPLKLDVKALVGAVGRDDFSKALALYERIAPLPWLLAQGCEGPCRQACKLDDIGDSIRIGDLERAVVRYGEKAKSRGMLRMQKKKTAAIFGSGLFTAFYMGEMARKMYPLTVYSAYDNAADFLAAAAPFASPEAVSRDSQTLAAQNITFVRFATIDGALLAEQRGNYDIVCISPQLLADLGGSVDERVMLWQDEQVISAAATTGVLASAWAARKAAVTADRLAQGLAPDNTRGDEGCVETRLYTNMEGIAGTQAVPCPPTGYTRQAAAAEAQRCIQCRCEECLKGCAYLRHYKKYPKKLTREIYNNANIIMGDHMMNKPINACSLCGQCTVTCPNGYDMAEICLAARQNMVATGKMPLAPHEFALLDMEFSNKEAFLCRPQPGFDRCQYVFFPGCQAAAIAPETVWAAYRDLAARLPGGVGLILGCCGAIAHWSGREGIYEDVCALLDKSLAVLGNPTIIAGCPTCAKLLAGQRPERVIGIWQVLQELGLPPGGRPLEQPAAMHDSCGARGDAATQQAIRRIAAKLGCELVPSSYEGDSAPCCGYGGLVMYANRQVAQEMAASCMEAGDLPYITYCMACRDRLAREGRISRHILELVYGTDAGNPPDISEKRYNRLCLKERLLKEVWKEETAAVEYDFTVAYTEEARALMADRMILTSDVLQALQYMRETKEAVCDGETGLLITRHRDGNVTFWVKYEETADGYLVHSAYSHRMKVVTR